MNAYRFQIAGIFAVLMAENDEAALDKVFGHCEDTRNHPDLIIEDELLATGTLTRIGEPDEVITNIEVWRSETKFVAPEGSGNG